ncbi:MAG: alpha-galactosidase [Actinobacteria bacterium]|nr:alpha-galactosidase [Actinomycetota bacterium]MBU1944553.1 alpha-galactosidase [Actinomycetota bacterium]MBU2689106.1 alpha-galactosidase [Actinomycetota bacterium]
MSEERFNHVVEAEGCRLEFDTEAGKFSVTAGETTLFEGAFGLAVLLEGKKKRDAVAYSLKENLRPFLSPAETRSPNSHFLAFESREDWGSLLFRARAEGKALVLEAGVAVDEGANPISVHSLIPLHVPPGGVWPGRREVKNWRAYVNGFQCWTPTGVVKVTRPGDYLFPRFFPRKFKPMLANTATPVSSDAGMFDSEWFGALADLEGSDSVVIGFTGVRRALSQVALHIGYETDDTHVDAAARFEGREVGPGETLWSEPLAIIPGGLEPDNFETYAEMVAREQGVEAVRRPPAGWCSWYQYFTAVTASDIRKNLDALSGEHSRLGIEVIQIDDGYQPAVGDWLETNSRFPDGMKPLAGEIASKGKIPGIWVAPFTALRGSRVFHDHPDWVLSTKRLGRRIPILAGVSPMWKWRFYGLDPTHPEVLDYLREVFTTFSAAGYRFFKLDFMTCGMLEGVRHDLTITRAEAVRAALQVIREAVGPDAWVMAAGGPVMLGVGILDAQRVSGDVAPFWHSGFQKAIRDRATPGTRNSILNTMERAFLSGRLFDGDPDVLMVRSTDTKMTLAERRTLASVLAVFGGSFMLSDDVALLSEEDLALAAASVPHPHALPRCPDLWADETPRLLVSRLEDVSGLYHLACAINWAGQPRDATMTLAELGLEGRYHACEFWSGAYLGEVTDELTVEGLDPHACALLRLTEATDAPRLIGSSMNLAQGASELERLETTPGGVSLAVVSPVECMAVVTLSLPGAGDATVADDDVTIERLSTTAYRLEFGLEGRREIEITYSPSPPGGEGRGGGDRLY